MTNPLKVKDIEWEEVASDVWLGNNCSLLTFMIINLELRLNNVIQGPPFDSLQAAKDKAFEILQAFIEEAVEHE